MKKPTTSRLTAALKRRQYSDEAIASIVEQAKGTDGRLTVSGVRVALEGRDDAEDIVNEARGGEPAAVQEPGTQTTADPEANEETGTQSTADEGTEGEHIET